MEKRFSTNELGGMLADPEDTFTLQEEKDNGDCTPADHEALDALQVGESYKPEGVDYTFFRVQ